MPVNCKYSGLCQSQAHASICSCLSYSHTVCESPHLTTYLDLKKLQCNAQLTLREGSRFPYCRLPVLQHTRLSTALAQRATSTAVGSRLDLRHSRHSTPSTMRWPLAVLCLSIYLSADLYAPGARKTESSNCEPSTVAPECAIGTAIHLPQ